jgi:hypothetical protein
VTFSVTVFETALPFFGVTVTVTLHEPAFVPFRDVPLTLQYLAEDDATFRETREPAATVIFAYLAIEVPVADFFVETTGATETVAVEDAGAAAATGAAVVSGAWVEAGAWVVAGAVLCAATVDCGAAVVGAAVVGAAVVGAEVVEGAVVVVAAALVTANV